MGSGWKRVELPGAGAKLRVAISGREFASTCGIYRKEPKATDWQLLEGRRELDLEFVAEDRLGHIYAQTTFFAIPQGGKNGVMRDVVLKVQFRGIAETIDSDLVLLERIARLFLTVQAKQFDVSAVFDELREVLKLETDYLHEADALERYRARAHQVPGLRVPEVFHELSTRRVLALSFEKGLTLDAFMATAPTAAQRHRKSRMRAEDLAGRLAVDAPHQRLGAEDARGARLDEALKGHGELEVEPGAGLAFDTGKFFKRGDQSHRFQDARKIAAGALPCQSKPFSGVASRRRSGCLFRAAARRRFLRRAP